MEYRIRFLILVLLLNVYSSCALLKKIITPPKVKLEEIRVDSIDLKNVFLIIALSVKNTNGFDFTITKLNYSLDVNNKKITTGVFNKKVNVKSHSQTTVEIPLTVGYNDIFHLAINIMKKTGIPYHVTGDIKVSHFTLDFNETGQLKLDDL